METGIWWLRRDLRLADNQALQAALAATHQVIPVFILDPQLLRSSYSSEKRTAFLFAALKDLGDRLKECGSTLVIRQGDPLEELDRLRQETAAGGIFAEADYSPFARQRDCRLEAQLPVQWCGSPAYVPPGSILKSNGQPYTVFTPFSRAWKALAGMPARPIPAPERIATPAGLFSLHIPGIPAIPAQVCFPATGKEALYRLEVFTGGPIYTYTSRRNCLDQEGTSGLSPYLRFGMLSARQVVYAAYQAIKRCALLPPAAGDQERKNAETWLNELVWREFYLHILYHFPHVRQRNFRLPGLHWQASPTHFAAWCAGQTGYPVVDAAMRQLAAAGWMHNRARMIAASFLVKDLLLDWRLGERYFMQHLVDGDPAANNGGWQWNAGTGTDAAPYFRVFNPVRQGKQCDPAGHYVRRWVPELEHVPVEYIHEPWLMPAALQVQAGCLIGSDYPAPLMDHAQARQRALELYGTAR